MLGRVPYAKKKFEESDTISLLLEETALIIFATVSGAADLKKMN